MASSSLDKRGSTGCENTGEAQCPGATLVSQDPGLTAAPTGFQTAENQMNVAREKKCVGGPYCPPCLMPAETEQTRNPVGIRKRKT